MKVGSIIGQILFARSPRKYHLPQSMIGVYLWCEGASQDALTTLSHFGLSQSVKAIRDKVDKLGEDHDNQLVQWKQSRQVYFLGEGCFSFDQLQNELRYWPYVLSISRFHTPHLFIFYPIE